MTIHVDKVCGVVGFVDPMLWHTTDGSPVNQVLIKGAEGAETVIIVPLALAEAFREQVGKQVSTRPGEIQGYSLGGMVGTHSDAVLVQGFACV